MLFNITPDQLFNIHKFNEIKNRSSLEFNVLNIGLHVDGKEPEDGLAAQLDRTIAAIFDVVSGRDMVVDHFEVVEDISDEPFVLVRTVGEQFRGFLWQNVAKDVCERLEQDCFGVVRRKIRQERSGFVEVFEVESALVGPRADQWGEFDSAFFTDSPFWENRNGQNIALVDRWEIKQED